MNTESMKKVMNLIFCTLFSVKPWLPQTQRVYRQPDADPTGTFRLSYLGRLPGYR